MKISHLLAPIAYTIITQVVAVAFAYILSPLSGVFIFQPVSGAGAPVFNALIFVLLPIIGTSLYLKLRKIKKARTFYAMAEALLILLLTFLILTTAIGYFAVSAALALAIAVGSYFALLKGERGIKVVVGIIMASEAGAYLAIIFMPPTVYLVFLFFALYDLVAVFRGPLRNILDEPAFGMLSVDFGFISVGLGDEVFYSMVPSTAYFIGGLPGALAVTVVTDVGVLVTLLLLSKRKALPGLTIPLLISLIFFLFLFR